MTVNKNKKNTAAAADTVNEEENVMQTEITANQEENKARNPMMEALPATEEKVEDLTEENIPEEVRALVWPLVQQKRIFESQIGDKGIKLEEEKVALVALQEEIKEKQETIKALTEDVAIPQVRINQLDKMIKDLMTPVTLKACVGVVKTAKAATSGPSDRALNTALEILSEIARIADVNEFKSEHLQQAKGCGRDTAGGILHRWEGAGIIERKSVGVYGIAPQYSGLI